MLTDADLRELVQLNVPESVLSVYLNTEPSLGNADAYRLRLRTMLKEIDLQDDVDAVERYFKTEYDWSGRGIAIFSCAKEGFFQTFPLALAVRDMVQVGDRPSIKPLANLLENYGGYGVALVDKQGARLFSFHMGELSEQDGFLGQEVKHTKSGGASSLHGQRAGAAGKTKAMDETVERNMKEIADYTIHFFDDRHVRRVLIGGTDDNVAMFRNLLPKAWQSLVVGSFPMSMAVSHADVLAKTLEIGLQAEQNREKRLVEALITAAAKKADAVVGLEETLAALNHNRIKTLVIMEHLHASGYRCPECNSLTTKPGEPCDSCGGKTEVVHDVVEAAIAAVIRNSGDIEVVRSLPEFVTKGGIGALLRY